jgi:PAS domain S-box-containing protein
MSSVETAAANGPDKNAPVPVGMVSHLKHLIESLPVCVMRTDLEGCLLAANDSALQLLGVTEHAKVLTKSLTERISAEHVEDWRGFLQRGWSEGASSVECELIDFTGAHRVIIVKSVAQPMHADGIQSLILTAQDLASRRRLERALNEHQGCATKIDALQSQLEQSEAQRQGLTALLETLQAGSGDKSSEHESALAALQQQIAELQGTLAAKDQEWQRRCDGLTAEVTQHDAERQQLASRLEERLADSQRLTETAAAREAEHQAASDLLRDRIAELERSTVTGEQAWQTRHEGLTAQLAEQSAERQKLSSLLEERDAERQRISGLLDQRDAEHKQLSELLEQRLADQQTAGEALQRRIGDLERSLTVGESEWQHRCNELTAQLTEHAAARLQLTSALERGDADHAAAANRLRQRILELEASSQATEHDWRKRCDALASQMASLSAERDRLASLLEEHHADQRTVDGTLRRRIEELERSLKANEEEWHKQRADLSAQLTVHFTEHERLSALLKQRVDDYERQAGLLAQHETECQRLTALLKQREGEHQAAVEALQQQIVECERALTSNDEVWKQRCEELSTQLTAQDDQRKERWDALTAQVLEHANERRRLAGLLEYREAEQRRLVDEHVAEKAQIEQSVRGACERAHAELDETRRREIETLRQDMGQLVQDLRRTAAQLAQRTAEYQTLTADMQALAKNAVDPIEVQGLMKSVAAYRIELVQITENTIRTLEPMATAGRVAIASSRELQAAVEAVDARSRELLAKCALDDVNRPEIERLRRDSIGAASLVRQLLQVFGDSTRAGGNEPASMEESQ